MLAEYFAAVNFTDLLVGMAALLLAIALRQWIQERELPPGPFGLPLLGYLPFLSDKPHIQMQNMRKKYGPVFSMKIGSVKGVVLADFASIKEAFFKQSFMGRPLDLGFDMDDETLKSGAFSHLPWMEQRRFSLHVFRDLGLGKSKLETHLREEIQYVLENIEQANGQAMAMTPILSPSTSNNIASLIFGKRLTFDDPERKKLDRVMKTLSLLPQKMPWFQFFPFLKPIAKLLGLEKNSEVGQAFADLKHYIVEEIAKHRESLDPNHIRDYLDGYLLEIEKEKGNPKTTFKDPVLIDLVKFFFLAGSETVRSAIEWLILILAAFPDVQQKVQAEIDEVIGSERFPSKSDSLRMPYTEAVIMETLRWRASTPVNPPRCTIEDTELYSYKIPKNMHIHAIIWAVHHDADLWGPDVEEFKPERFLSKDRKRVRAPEFYMPFSFGKRSCPGESFALMEVFLYLAALFQRFEARLPEGAKADLEGVLGISLQPKPFKVCFTNRQ